ncbi:MAG: cellobiose phosphorylase [Spirochaetia bacterium]|nr:cellobiose phosphorylase [Spirochaetia bacterium]
MQVFQQIDYYNRPAFSGFLPGIAGLHGIPVWAFYVNRGQGIVSFGSESKDGSIAEFFSAANAYRTVSEQGFRTFIKPTDGSARAAPVVYEPFAKQVAGSCSSITVDSDQIALSETNEEIGVRVDVVYRTVPNARVGALVREIRITNISGRKLSFEIVDGLSVLIPAGIDYGALKNNLTTAQAWMTARRTRSNAAVYQLAATMSDSANVQEITRLNFALGYRRENKSLVPVEVLHDADLLFIPQQAMNVPVHFCDTTIDELVNRTQIENGKLPCAFFADAITLLPNKSSTLVEFYGAASSQGLVEEFMETLSSPAVIESYYEQNRALLERITGVCETQTANQKFDAYTRQNFLDNVLRGGFPHIEQTLGGDVYIPVYSRKHGDLERDYNWFVIPAEYYSQGWGNYRDVNQNRRSDVFFVPQAGLENLWEFMSLIQTDGYNPLIVQGRGYQVPADVKVSSMVQDLPKTMSLIHRGNFSPGELYHSIENECVTSEEVQDLFRSVLGVSETIVHAVHGEGFWIDHWIYNNDLLENCMAVFPERTFEIFWNQRIYPYYRSEHFVQPRRKKWVVTDKGIQQYNAVQKPKAEVDSHDFWMSTPNGTTYFASLGEKMLGLAAIKFLTRDPYGIGVEMEADKPGWYDALNGLPGLLGSSLPEAWELLRLIRNIELGVVSGGVNRYPIAVEIYELYRAIEMVLSDPVDSDLQLHNRWNIMATYREEYRETTRCGFSGEQKTLERAELLKLLHAMEADVKDGLLRGKNKNDGVYPTYLIIQPTDASAVESYIKTGSWTGEIQFSLRPLPLFLEGFVRALSNELDSDERDNIHATVMQSELYDKKLGMLRVNESLSDESHEIGRARAFTPGWLENGSIWLHMEYKYLLALLRSGKYQEFWQLADTMLVPFMDPTVYGRSIFENSSFIVSSAHPDESLHGRGFVARLSGSTAEFISMWIILFFGKTPFQLVDGKLELVLSPCLPHSLFNESGKVACTFFHGTRVTYVNKTDKDVVPGGDVQLRHITVRTRGAAEAVEFTGGRIPSPYAEMVRDGQIESLYVIMSN